MIFIVAELHKGCIFEFTIKTNKMNTEFKGTQGEWKVEQELGYDCDVIYEGGEICWLGLSDVSDEEKLPNAQLIAAAPELLKELQKIKFDIEMGFIDVRKSSPIYDGIVRAINKALGNNN